jgi:uncharacterized protein (TIGR02001 family)
MKLMSLIAVAAVTLAISAPAGAAESLVKADEIPGTFSANIAVTSEYYFRGLSQTDDAAAVQGGFDYEVGASKAVTLYLGVWGSNVDFNEAAGTDGATVEIDLYGGMKGELGDSGVGWDAGFVYYTYPGASGSLNYNFIEAQGALSYDFGIASASISLNYTPDNFGESGDAFYPKIAVEVPVGKYLILSGSLARQWIDKNDVFGQPDYTEWAFGGTVNLAGFDLNLTYTDTNIAGDPDGAGAAVLFTISRSF